MTVLPAGDRVLIAPDPPPSVSQGGILLTERAFAPEQTGTIVGIGPLYEAKARMSRVSVGSRVVFPWTSGQELKIGTDRYLVLRGDDLLAVMEEEEEEYDA